MSTFLIRSLLKLTLAALYFALPFVVGHRLECIDGSATAQVAALEAAGAEADAAAVVPAAADVAQSPQVRVRSSMRWRLTLPVAALRP